MLNSLKMHVSQLTLPVFLAQCWRPEPSCPVQISHVSFLRVLGRHLSSPYHPLHSKGHLGCFPLWAAPMRPGANCQPLQDQHFVIFLSASPPPPHLGAKLWWERHSWSLWASGQLYIEGLHLSL